MLFTNDKGRNREIAGTSWLQFNGPSFGGFAGTVYDLEIIADGLIGNGEVFFKGAGVKVCNTVAGTVGLDKESDGFITADHLPVKPGFDGCIAQSRQQSAESKSYNGKSE